MLYFGKYSWLSKILKVWLFCNLSFFWYTRASKLSRTDIWALHIFPAEISIYILIYKLQMKTDGGDINLSTYIVWSHHCLPSATSFLKLSIVQWSLLVSNIIFPKKYTILYVMLLLAATISFVRRETMRRKLSNQQFFLFILGSEYQKLFLVPLGTNWKKSNYQNL